MNLQMNVEFAQGYKNRSQIARVLTENWLGENGYCPHCGNDHVHPFHNNRPAADFYCEDCHEEFELKSKYGKIPDIVTDGAHTTMLERVRSENNPHLFLLGYTKEYSVSDVVLIPKYFFTPDVIIQRPPLSSTAKRAGWIGCNINVSKIPVSGKIYLVENSKIRAAEQVRQDYRKTLFLKQRPMAGKGWILDIMNCIDGLQENVFSLTDIYGFENEFQEKYPGNRFIREKIRQQLQLLRDHGMIEFIGRGKHKKVEYPK